MTTRHAIFTAALMTAGLLSPVFAQRDAGSKARGNIYNFWSAKSAQSHAQDHSRAIYYYGQAQQTIAAPQVKEHAGAVRSNLTASGKSLQQLKKENADNKEAQEIIKKIESLHKDALGHCDMLDKEVASEDAKHSTVEDCCVGMHEVLDAADKEMSKLMKVLQIQELPPPKKGAAKAETKPGK